MQSDASSPTPPPNPPLGVPEELMARLHEANQHFSQIAARLKGVADLGFRERQELAAQLRGAARQAEAITEQINQILRQQ